MLGELFNAVAATQPINTSDRVSRAQDNPLVKRVAAAAASNPTPAHNKRKEALTETELTRLERMRLDALRRRDEVVRRNEEAQRNAAGPLAKERPSYQYQYGPDRQKYAVDGNLRVDTREGRTPEETIRRAVRLRATAYSAVPPDTEDLQLAAKANQMEAEARRELFQRSRNEYSQLVTELKSRYKTGQQSDGPPPHQFDAKA